jgi:hypothetical protein
LSARGFAIATYALPRPDLLQRFLALCRETDYLATQFLYFVPTIAGKIEDALAGTALRAHLKTE